MLKTDGSIRLCGDFKTTINSRLEVEQHPIPKVEDILAHVNGCEKINKIDLEHAYLPSDGGGDKNIPHHKHENELFMYNRLPFGISSARAHFQRVINRMSGYTGLL